jgi:hypothetical protein
LPADASRSVIVTAELATDTAEYTAAIASGNLEEALEAFSSYETRLQEELQVESLDHTKALVQDIRNKTSANVVSSPITVLTAPDSKLTTNSVAAAGATATARRRNNRWVPALAIAAVAVGVSWQMLLDRVTEVYRQRFTCCDVALT